jgi:hypothetical protein
MPTIDVPERTQEVSLADIEVDADLKLDSQERFNTHFKRQIEQRPFENAIREDAGRFERLRARAADGDAAARDLVNTVNDRIASFRAVQENADATQLLRQHTALVRDEARPEQTGNVHIAERYALATLRTESLHRSRHLADNIAGDYFNELKALPPWDRDEIKTEAATLMATQERAFDEYPFGDNTYLRDELLTQHEHAPEYGRLCALMLKANATPSNWHAYEVERDPVLYKQAQDRATSLLEKDPSKVDAMLQRELADAKLDVVFAEMQGNSEALRSAQMRAGQLAIIYEVLPTRRALEVDTGPMRRRPS